MLRLLQPQRFSGPGLSPSRWHVASLLAISLAIEELMVSRPYQNDTITVLFLTTFLAAGYSW